MSGKGLVLQLWLKILSANQITVFFDHQYLWKESIDILDFLRGNNHQGKIGSEATSFVSGQLGLLSCQIAGSFDYQYHWKESINNFDFLHGDSHR